jgi:hypothetical protein
MHRSRLCALLIDCQVPDIDVAAKFWSAALGREVNRRHPGNTDDYQMLDVPPDEIVVQIQRVDHESRVHIDIETDNVSAEVTRLERLGAVVEEPIDEWVVMRAPTGQRFCVVKVLRPGFPKNANLWE